MLSLGIRRGLCSRLSVLLLAVCGTLWLCGCPAPTPGDDPAETQPLPNGENPPEAIDPPAQDDGNASDEPDLTPEPPPEQPIPDEPPAPQQFSLTVTISGDGSVTPDGGLFDLGDEISLLASPEEGWHFDGWIGGVISFDNPLVLAIESAIDITAVFIRQYTLVVEVSGGGSVEIDPPGGLYDDGTIVSVTAIPVTGQQFNGWSGDLTGVNPDEEIVVDSNKRITAVFTPQLLETPPAPSGGGSPPPPPPPPPGPTGLLTLAVFGNGDVVVTPLGVPVVVADGSGWQLPLDSVVTLTPVDGANACFVRWGGDVASSESTLEFTLTQETFVLAVFADPTGPALAPMLDPSPAQTTAATVNVTGDVQSCTTDPVAEVEVASPAGLSRVPAVDGSFSAEVALRSNSTNHILFTAISESGVRGAPAPLEVTQDSQPPALFIDFPPDGAALTNDSIDVAGRVSDTLSGFMGLTVVVKGLPAIVDVGIGTNGTFERASVPLTIGPNTIDVVATDELGNSVARSITVTRVELPAFTPLFAVVSGLGQSGPIHGLLAEPIVARVNRRDGTPFANKTVTFRVTRSDGRL